MEYLNFELRIGVGSGSEYPVTVVHSPAGEVSATAHIPIDESDFVDDLARLETARGPVRGSPAASAPGPPVRAKLVRRADEPGTDERAVAREIGSKLFEALFREETRSSYRSSLTSAREDGKGLRLRLRIEAPELAALPWEFLFDAAEGDYICLSLETPVTRYLELPRPTHALAVQPPIRILGMVASPRDPDLPQLKVALEKQRIASAVEHLQDRGDLELIWVEGETYRDLQAALASGRWHIFHFIGHGSFDRAKGEGHLLFCDDEGRPQPISAVELGRLFAGHPSLRLALLNACEGARISDSNLYSSVGSVLMRRGIPAVISMQYSISDRAAVEFSRLFYDALAREEPVDAAVTTARTAISVGETIEWATPVLHMRSPDGRLFDFDVPGLVFPQTARTPAQRAPSLQPGTPIGAVPVPQEVEPPASDDERRGQEILLRRVKQGWIEGVLEKSLFRATMIDLGMEATGSDVENPWTTTVERPAARSEPLSQQKTIAGVFDEEGGSLLILGAPGSGKTTSLLGLARTLIARAERDPNLPVPVVFPLSSWAESRDALVRWMASELAAKYQVPRKIGQARLESGRILPLLDGLDEQVADTRAACVSAINEYVLQTGLTGVVVCCGLKEYTGLPNRLALNAAVRLRELRDDQVQDYLTAGGDELGGLRVALQRDSALRIDARLPLMLNLMIQAYWGLSTADIEREGEESAAARRRNLMGAYAREMFRRASLGRMN